MFIVKFLNLKSILPLLALGCFLVPAAARASDGHPASPSSITSIEKFSLAQVFLNLFPQFTSSREPLCSSRSTALDDPQYYFASARNSLVVRIQLSDTAAHEAYADLGREIPTIVISRTLLRQLETEHELAFVLAHEMGHIMAGHRAVDLSGLLLSERQLRRISQVRARWELEADAFAKKAVMDAGYSLKAAPLLARLSTSPPLSASESIIQTHPALPQRLALLHTHN